jgi:uncharacterized protein (DUF983 family)
LAEAVRRLVSNLNVDASESDMSKTLSARNRCPACGGSDVIRVDPYSLNFAKASHGCQTCGAELSSHLKWSKAAAEFGIGALLLLVGFAVCEMSKHLPSITPKMRLVAFLALMGGVLSFSAQRIFKAIEFKPWVQKP